MPLRSIFAVFLAPFVLPGTHTQAQTTPEPQRIWVVNEATRQPIGGVLVYGTKNVPALALERLETDDSGYVLLPKAYLQRADTVRFVHPDYLRAAYSPFDLDVRKHTVALTESAFSAEEVVETANRSGQNRNLVAGQIHVIAGRFAQLHNPPNTASLLEQGGLVYVQRSQMGGGSPVLRGLEANRILVVVDGVRMNNAIFGGRHLQNVLGVDVNLLERTEVLFGPAAVAHGSDAMGGVVHLMTRQPKLGLKASPLLRTNAMTRYASATDEFTGHLDFNAGFGKVASLTSASFSTFGDQRMGAWQNPFWGDFGLRKYYQDRIGGRDTAIRNADPRVQVGSGYSQMDLVQKLLWAPNGRFNHQLNVQYSLTSAVPRYDRLSEVARQDSNGRDVFNYAEWEYGPQSRLQASYRFQHGRTPVYDKLIVMATFQRFQESRISRGWQSDWRTSRYEQVEAYIVMAQAEKGWGGAAVAPPRAMLGPDSLLALRAHAETPVRHRVYYGFEALLNQVESRADARNVNTNASRPASTLHPEGGTTWSAYAAYARHECLAAPWLTLNSGLRYNQVQTRASFGASRQFFGFLPHGYTNSAGALAGNLAAIVAPTQSWRLGFTLASAFRAANAHDLSKVSDSLPGRLVAPNPNLAPEYTYTAEVSSRLRLGQRLNIEGYLFYSLLDNFMDVGPYGGLGADSALHNGVNSFVTAVQNTRQGCIYGFSGQLDAAIARRWAFRQTFTYTTGRNLAHRGPLGGIPPIFGTTSLTYTRARFQGVFCLHFNGWKRIGDYSPGGEDNQQHALPVGTPAWHTFSLKGQYAVLNNLLLSVGVENLLDAHYRTFMSGISAPGRNLVVALRLQL